MFPKTFSYCLQFFFLILRIHNFLFSIFHQQNTKVFVYLVKRNMILLMENVHFSTFLSFIEILQLVVIKSLVRFQFSATQPWKKDSAALQPAALVAYHFLTFRRSILKFPATRPCSLCCRCSPSCSTRT